MEPGATGAFLKLTRRLTLVIHSLAQGGAERDMAHLARCWAERGDDVAVVTLVVTYVLQVVGAVTGARQLAGAAHALGETPQAVVTRAWTGSGFDGLATHLANLVPLVEAHGRRHEAYPALHFFQSRERRTSAPTMLAVLDEALLLLADGVAPEARLAPAEVEPLRRVLGAYLDTLSVSFVNAADEAPEAPALGPLAAAGVPVVEDGEFARAVEIQRQRRRCLLGLVRDAGREWTDVPVA